MSFVINDKGELNNEAKPLLVHPTILNRVWLFDVDDEDEIILLHVDENYYDFAVKETGGWWMITVCDATLPGDMRYETDYVFGEPVEVEGKIGLFSLTKYEFLLERIGLKAKDVLILKRKIK